MLEKVVRKLRSGQMPPAGPAAAGQGRAPISSSPRSRRALDKAAASAPNPGPGRRAPAESRSNTSTSSTTCWRSTSTPQLLPADNGGVGLRQQRRHPVGHAGADDPLHVGGHQDQPAGDRRSRRIARSIQVYKVAEFGDPGRADERGPAVWRRTAASPSSTPSRSTASTASRCACSATSSAAPSAGIDDEHEIEVRIDRALVKRFKVGGQYKGSDPGMLIAVPEDDVEGQKLHAYRLDADNDLATSRCRSRPAPRTGLGGVHRQRAGGRRDGAAARAVDQALDFTTMPARRASTRSTSRVRTTAAAPGHARAAARSSSAGRPAAREEDACARRRSSSTLARRAYRRPVTDADMRELMQHLHDGRHGRRLRRRHRARARSDCCRSPAFLFRIERDRPAPRPGQTLPGQRSRARLAPVVLPVEEHPGRRAARRSPRKGRLKDPAVLRAAGARACWRTGKRPAGSNDFVGPVAAACATCRRRSPIRTSFPDFDDTLREAMSKETELFFESQVREDRPVHGAAARRLHLPERSGWRGTTASPTSTAATSAGSPTDRSGAAGAARTGAAS